MKFFKRIKYLKYARIPAARVQTTGIFKNRYSECFPEILQLLLKQKFLPIMYLIYKLKVYFCQKSNLPDILVCNALRPLYVKAMTKILFQNPPQNKVKIFSFIILHFHFFISNRFMSN